MKKILFTLLALGSTFSFGQIDEEAFEEKMQMEVEQKNYSWAQKNFFFDFKLSSAPEVFIRKKTEYTYYQKSDWSTEWQDTFNVVDKGISVSVIGLTMEPRINLTSARNHAFFVKLPITLSFSITGNNGGRRTRGFCHAAVPILFGYATGFNSSYSNTKSKGLSIAAGVQYLRSPLFGGDQDIHTWDDADYLGLEDIVYQKNWIMPMVQVDYSFVTRRGKMKGLSLAVAPYNGFYAKVAYNFIGTKK